MPASVSARLVSFEVLDANSCIGLATPTQTKISFSLPTDEAISWDLLSVTWNPGSVAVADAGGVTLKADKVTTAAGTTTAIFANTSIVAGAIAADVPTMLFRGRVSMTGAGDHVTFTFTTDGALTTPAVGASIIVEFEIMERSGV